MLRINWTNNCYECKNPITVKVFLETFKTFFYLRNFATHKPFCMFGNSSMIKYYGNMKCRRVCLACYFSPRNHLDYLKNREIGKMRKPDRLRSKTRQEIYEWFEDFDRYRKRKDIKDCLMPKLGTVPGLNVYLLGTLDGDSESY
tara:strand:+ start:6740 stop:7171 length:432 start_codon:yes stop_codon:yes gene_type:complete